MGLRILVNHKKELIRKRRLLKIYNNLMNKIMKIINKLKMYSVILRILKSKKKLTVSYRISLNIKLPQKL